MKEITDDMGYSIQGLNEDLTDEEWNDIIKSHCDWLIDAAHEAADHLKNNHLRMNPED